MTLNVVISNRYSIHKLGTRNRARAHAVPAGMTSARPNQWKFDEPVSGANLFLYRAGEPSSNMAFSSLTGPLTSTSRRGRARLDMPDQNGDYLLRIRPDPWSIAPVGPNFGATFSPVPSRVYRPLDVQIRIAGHAGNRHIGNASIKGSTVNGVLTSTSNDTIKLALQPAWVTDHSHHRTNRTDIDLIVVHLTSGSDPYGAVTTIASHAGAHYLILKGDGQIIKFLKDMTRGGHAGRGDRTSGQAYWKGNTNINARSIGIELENVEADKVDPEFSEAQYKSLLWLLDQLVTQHGIDPRRVIGHSDVGVWLDTRLFDPGLRFDWPRLDRAGFGPAGPGSGYPSVRTLNSVGSEAYGGLFKGGKNDPELRIGDNDREGRYGNKLRAGITGSPIFELVSDLQTIGYWVGPRGPTGRLTTTAVRAAMHFQHHFFATQRLNLTTSERAVRIDGETAMMIRDVSSA